MSSNTNTKTTNTDVIKNKYKNYKCLCHKIQIKKLQMLMSANTNTKTPNAYVIEYKYKNYKC